MVSRSSHFSELHESSPLCVEDVESKFPLLLICGNGLSQFCASFVSPSGVGYCSLRHRDGCLVTAAGSQLNFVPCAEL